MKKRALLTSISSLAGFLLVAPASAQTSAGRAPVSIPIIALPSAPTVAVGRTEVKVPALRVLGLPAAAAAFDMAPADAVAVAGTAASAVAPADAGAHAAVPEAVDGRPAPMAALAPDTYAAALAPGRAADAAAAAAPTLRRRASAAAGLSGALRAAVIATGTPVDPALLAVEPEGSSAAWVAVEGMVRRDGLLGEPVATAAGTAAGQGGVLGEPVARVALVAPDGAGVWRLQLPDAVDAADSLVYITTVSFQAKRNGYLNGYHIGTYPTELAPRSDAYAPPVGFIEVTPENQNLQVSKHFRLRQFLTKDQFDVWPKYLALNLRLVDKLELVIQELNAMGVRALGMHVMSGFRTPQYNGPGGDGRATLSRHMYGDAADIWVDGDNDGYIDDLNGDGRHDIRDAEVLLRAVERVEQKYPELTGGAGLYEANAHHGPYVHVDVRGSRARW